MFSYLDEHVADGLTSMEPKMAKRLRLYLSFKAKFYQAFVSRHAPYDRPRLLLALILTDVYLCGAGRFQPREMRRRPRILQRIQSRCVVMQADDASPLTACIVQPWHPPRSLGKPTPALQDL